MAILTDDLITGVKRRITLPANRSLIQDADILAFADTVMRDRIVPMVLAARQNYYLTTSLVAVTAELDTYDIPYRAVGRALRDVKYSLDGTALRSQMKDLQQFEVEDLQNYADTGTPEGFYFQGDKLVLVPEPVSSSEGILYFYDLKVAKLVASSACVLVGGTAATTVTATGSVPSTFAADVEVDFLEARSGHSTRAMDVTLSGVAGTTLTFATGVIPTDLVVGDYLALAGQSPVIQAPDEVFPLLETSVSGMVLDAISDFEGKAALEKDMARQDVNLRGILEPRVRGEPKKIINQHGLLRRGRGTWARNPRIDLD